MSRAVGRSYTIGEPPSDEVALGELSYCRDALNPESSLEL